VVGVQPLEAFQQYIYFQTAASTTPLPIAPICIGMARLEQTQETIGPGDRPSIPSQSSSSALLGTERVATDGAKSEGNVGFSRGNSLWKSWKSVKKTVGFPFKALKKLPLPQGCIGDNGEGTEKQSAGRDNPSI
jgi:hypothetical protein